MVDTHNHQLDIDKIKQLITPKTKAIIINSPNNPTGAVYPKESLLKVAKLAIKHNFFIISDEAYESIVFDGLKHYSIGSFSEEIKKRTISVFSFSKSHCMTGVRIGFTVAQKEIVEAINRLQSHMTGNVCTFAQHGAIKALEIGNKISSEWSKIFEKRRDLTFSLASKYFDCIKPKGAFYIFADVRKVLKKLNLPDSESFVNLLIEKTNVVFVPGEVFGVPDHIRIAYPLDEEKIKQAFERIDKVLK